MSNMQQLAMGIKQNVMYILIVTVELSLFANYKAHDAPIHFFLHSLIGLSVALLIYTVLTLLGKHPKRLLLTAFGLHQFAMFPDYLYQIGIPHRPWMNIFLGHLWIDNLHYHEWVLGGSVVALTIVYILSRRYKVRSFKA